MLSLILFLRALTHSWEKQVVSLKPLKNETQSLKTSSKIRWRNFQTLSSRATSKISLVRLKDRFHHKHCLRWKDFRSHMWQWIHFLLKLMTSSWTLQKWHFLKSYAYWGIKTYLTTWLKNLWCAITETLRKIEARKQSTSRTLSSCLFWTETKSRWLNYSSSPICGLCKICRTSCFCASKWSGQRASRQFWSQNRATGSIWQSHIRTRMFSCSMWPICHINWSTILSRMIQQWTRKLNQTT